MWEKLKELKEVVALMSGFLLVLMAIGGVLLEWRIDTNVRAAVANHSGNSISPEQLEVVVTKLGAIKEDVMKLEGNDNRLENKIDKVINILLED